MKREVLEKLTALIIAAFGLIAALAWNDAIREIFQTVFDEQAEIIAMITYAVLVTIVAVFVSIYLGRLAEEKK